MLLQKRYTVVNYQRFCLTGEKEFYSLSSSAVCCARVNPLFRRLNSIPRRVIVMNKKIISLFAVFSLWGCAAVTPQSSSSTAAGGTFDVKAETVVSARAEARWKAMIAHDLDGAYEFLSPGSKSANPPAAFKAKIRPLDWRSAKALSAKCDNEKCSVEVKVAFSDRRFGEVNTVLEETWIKDGGNWWYVFRE
jgi:hypothetical protein